MRVALVHDYINQLGGAERVFKEIAGFFPRAPIYTLLAEPETTGVLLPGRRVIPSWLNRLPWVARRHYYALWAMPLAVECFDFSRFDLVISLSSSFAKGIVTGPETLHISYVTTPLRYVWDDYHRDRHKFPFGAVMRALIPYAIHYLRIWDFAAAKRPDQLITISRFSRECIQKHYGRDAHVIYPPVDVKKYQIPNTKYQIRGTKYFLMVGRLTPYKRFDLAIETFNELGLSLWIVGDGPQRKELKRRAGANIRFLGWASEERLVDLYAGAEAFVFPQEEHFGLVAVEAMAAGTPVIAFRGGAALEIVREGLSGVFFNEQTPESLAKAVKHFRKADFDSALVSAAAERFDRTIFRKEFMKLVAGFYKS